MTNRVEEFKILEKMCLALVKAIGLHRTGFESSDEVLLRAKMLKNFIGGLKE